MHLVDLALKFITIAQTSASRHVLKPSPFGMAILAPSLSLTQYGVNPFGASV
jgi:hypothetical protein